MYGALLGMVLGVVALVGGGQVFIGLRGTLAEVAGVTATLAAALAAGVWAGAVPGGLEAGETHLFPRWVGAGLAVGAAGIFALVWEIAGPRLGPAGSVLALLLLIGLPVYALGFALPALRAWAEGANPDENDTRSEGAGARIAVGVLAGLAAGCLLAGVVLIPRFPAGTLLLGAAALFTSPLMRPRPESGRSIQTTVWEEETPFGTLAVVDTVFPGQRQPERRLYLDDEIESGELVRGGTPTFAYVAAAERWLADLTPPGSSYLFLGGGAYTLPRRIAEHDPRAQIAVGELDPEVTRVATRFFGLRPEHRIHAVHGDARRILEGMAPGGYDRIFIDVYDGREVIPYSLVTREAWEAAARALRPGGVVGMNVIGVAQGPGSRRFWSVVRTAVSAFPAFALYIHLGPDFPDPQNFLVAGSPDPAFVFPPQAGSFERWERPRWPGWAGTTVFRDRFGEPEAPG